MSLDPQRKHLAMMEKMIPDYRYHAGENFARWQETGRARLEKVLGLPFEKCEENFRVAWTEEDEKSTEIRILFASEEQVDVSCHLVLPKNVEGKLPLVICLQGHSKGMHISLGRPIYAGDEDTINGGDRDFARQIVARGQAALAIEQRAFGERGGTPEGPACYQPGVQALMLGRTLIGERCWDVSRAIDMVLGHFPQIDENKIAIMGNSGGGTISVYAPALDLRIAAAMPSCAFSGYMASIGAQHHCLCNYVPGIMKDFDMGDIAGLIAPRPLIVVNGKDDGIFPLASANEQFDVARAAYAAANAPQNIEHVVGAMGHRFYAADAWPVFDRLTGWREECV